MLRLCNINDRILTLKNLPKVLNKQMLIDSQWIDAYEPTPEERGLLKGLLRTDLPDSTEVEEIEASARFFVDHLGIHVHSLFLGQKEGRSQTVSVAFILHPDRLMTLRKGLDLADFRLLRMRARMKRIEVDTPKALLLSIFEQKVENLADVIEDIFGRLVDVSHQVLEEDNTDYEDSIEQLAKQEDTNGKIRLCLMDTQRSLAFLQRQFRGDHESLEAIHDMTRDIETLLSHTGFLFEKINFLMDAALGFINIQQNQIIKTFSIAAVVFMPPTMIASIYGMNFEFMPELAWVGGYPAALFLMVLSGIAPYLLFKHKGWL